MGSDYWRYLSLYIIYKATLASFIVLAAYHASYSIHIIVLLCLWQLSLMIYLLWMPSAIPRYWKHMLYFLGYPSTHTILSLSFSL